MKVHLELSPELTAKLRVELKHADAPTLEILIQRLLVKGVEEGLHYRAFCALDRTCSGCGTVCLPTYVSLGLHKPARSCERCGKRLSAKADPPPMPRRCYLPGHVL